MAWNMGCVIVCCCCYYYVLITGTGRIGQLSFSKGKRLKDQEMWRSYTEVCCSFPQAKGYKKWLEHHVANKHN